MSKTTFSFLLIAAGFAVLYFFFLDQWASLQVGRADVNAAEAALEELRGLTAKRDALADTYNSVQAALLQKANAMVTSGPDVASLLTDLEAIAAKNGMVLRSVNFSQASDSKSKSPAAIQLNLQQGAYTLPITMQVLGTYSSFKRFLADLELNRRVLDITAINFTSAENQVYDFSMQLKAYYQQ